MTPMQEDLDRVLFDEPTILRRLDELARDITADYEGLELTVIAVLNGSFIFMADLLRRIPLPLKLDCLSVASYYGEAATTGEVVFKQIALPDVAGRHILILDDILDSGVTLAAIRDKLKTERPLSVKICVLLRKLKPRLSPVEADHVMNSSLVMASITWNDIVICPASASCGKTSSRRHIKLDRA